VGLVHGPEPGTLSDVPQTDRPGGDTAFDAATAVTRTGDGGLVAELDPGCGPARGPGERR